MDHAEPTTAPRRADARARTEAERDTCFYDGACGLCRRSVAVLRRLDWLDRLQFEDLNRTPDAELPFPREAALRGMPMRTAEGSALIGFEAVRRALGRTPIGWPVAMLLRLPGVRGLGRRVYEHVASRRARDGACEVCDASTPREGA